VLKLRKRFAEELNAKLDLLGIFFPYLKDYSNGSFKNGLLYNCSTLRMSKNDYITLQSQFGDSIYILQEGEVSFHQADQSQGPEFPRKTVDLFKVSSPALIGEEILFQSETSDSSSWLCASNSKDERH